MGVDEEKYFCIFIPTVMEKSPDAVRLSMINDELEIRERYQPDHRTARHDEDMKPRSTWKTQTSGSALHATTNAYSDGKGKRFCVFCKGNH